MRILFIFLIIAIPLLFIGSKQTEKKQIEPGAYQVSEYIPLLQDKRVALVVNHTSLIRDVHLLDSLLKLKIDVVKIFSPEHGFRGIEDAGEKIDNYIDVKTNIPIVSLYGKNIKPKPEDLEDIDVLVFDIQDVGVRFYTYISTLLMVMEAGAENNKSIIVLDRPNPNGHYIDGPVLDLKYKSFIGIVPVPIVYGMTIGELALMMNGEKWLKDSLTCDLRVILCQNYTHDSLYQLPVKPSPNLPNMQSVYLYPSLCLLEGTLYSIGRGTLFPFQIYGHPDYKGDFCFSPKSIPGAENPKFINKVCYGVDLTGANVPLKKLELLWLFDAYQHFEDKDFFFRTSFNFLTGNASFKNSIIEGADIDSLVKSWQPDIDSFKKVRADYLLYQ